MRANNSSIKQNVGICSISVESIKWRHKVKACISKLFYIDVVIHRYCGPFSQDMIRLYAGLISFGHNLRLSRFYATKIVGDKDIETFENKISSQGTLISSKIIVTNEKIKQSPNMVKI